MKTITCEICGKDVTKYTHSVLSFHTAISNGKYRYIDPSADREIVMCDNCGTYIETLINYLKEV